MANWWEEEPNAGVHQFSGDVVVTQCGSKSGFRPMPRFPDEFALSVIEGRMATVTDAIRCAFRRPVRRSDAARYFEVGRLQAHEYWAYSFPTSNPRHARISAPIGGVDTSAHQAWWERPTRVTLDTLASSEVVDHA